MSKANDLCGSGARNAKVLASLEILLTLALAASSASMARADICSNATLKPAYAFTIHGEILAGPAARVLDGIALTTFDGNGKLTPVDAVSENGVVGQVWRPATGSYSPNSDCTGSMTLVFENVQQPPLNLVIVVSPLKNTIHTVVLNSAVGVTSDAERVHQSRALH